TIQLELYRGSGFNLDNMQKASFTRMDINDLSVKYRSKANGDSKAEMAIVAVRAYDTRPGTENQFTQIISPTIATAHGKAASGSKSSPSPGPGSGMAASADASNDGAGDQHSNHASMYAMAQDTPIEEDSSCPQLICHVDMRPNQDMVVLLTLDSPRIILVLDHALLLMNFASSVFPQQSPDPEPMQTASVGSTDNSQPPANSNSTGGLIYKVDVLHPEIILLANPHSRSSEALILSINQIVLAQEGMFCATLDEIGVSLCTVDRRQETTRSIMDPFTIITTMDTREIPGNPQRGVQKSHATDISIDVGSLLLRLGINDVILMLDIFNTAMELFYKKDEVDDDSAQKLAHGHMRVASASASGLAYAGSAGTTAVPAKSAASLQRQDQSKQGSVRHSGSPSLGSKVSAFIVKETMRATIASLRIVVIRDMFGLPVYACTAKEFHVDVTDWSINMRVQSDMHLQASYFNRRNSHWEPF
ncbi:Vacuolar protein sorting-associated protein 13, partial [Coemansia sp. RSA 486]